VVWIALAAVALGACGGDFDTGVKDRRIPGGARLASTALAAPEPARGYRPPPLRNCGTLILTPHSDHGAFFVQVRNITCPYSFALLRSRTGLRLWRCVVIRRYAGGGLRYSCTSRTRLIVFTVF